VIVPWNGIGAQEASGTTIPAPTIEPEKLAWAVAIVGAANAAARTAILAKPLAFMTMLLTNRRLSVAASVSLGPVATGLNDEVMMEAAEIDGRSKTKLLRFVRSG
jgi:hypothetical protein